MAKDSGKFDKYDVGEAGAKDWFGCLGIVMIGPLLLALLAVVLWLLGARES